MHLIQVFSGKMSNIVKCGKCGNETSDTNTFISLLLSIDVGNYETYDVKTGLNSFEKHATLEEDDWMYCDSCACKTETETWTQIEDYPTILTLQLKRFNFNWEWMTYEKNNCTVDIPLKLPEEGNRPSYDLYAVVDHKGGYNSGHYTATIKNGKWYCFDDSNVRQVSGKPTMSELSYMLMYRKQVFNQDNVPHVMHILLFGPPRGGKSTTGNIILGGNYFPCESGSATVTKELMVKTVGKVTVVDTPNLFSLDKSGWNREIDKCVKLCDNDLNVILWVIPISDSSNEQQGLFHSSQIRLSSLPKMIIFTNGQELQNLGESIEQFIERREKLRKVVRFFQYRYAVIENTGGCSYLRYTSYLLEKISELLTLRETTASKSHKMKAKASKNKRVKK
ncbi:hypothetical protein DNTS_009052 [Danionella cerebrum]|uniref:USP domain-containing protein n=1 Tax=Danionella cerebrum TaxID=2873325 RepID=A0A553QZC3_9TELE|nr:hypothetical protein DNTS_009052 [Danionella translucida]